MRIATWQWGGRRHAGFMSVDGREVTPVALDLAEQPEGGLAIVRRVAAGRPLKPSGARLPASLRLLGDLRRRRGSRGPLHLHQGARERDRHRFAHTHTFRRVGGGGLRSGARRPMGPVIVSCDECEGQVNVRTFVNGDKRQDAHTRDLIFDVPAFIECISQGITLHPGDVIATGTPVGVGIGFRPPKYLKPGDVVRCEIDGIGVPENPVR